MKLMKMTIKSILFLLFIAVMATSCGDDSADYDQQMVDYLSKNNLPINKHEKGFYYVIDVPGGDEKPKVNSDVTVNYVGTLLNGTQFDKSPASGPLTFNLTSVILGWKYGIPLFGKGGKGKLIIPPSLGYGGNSIGAIPSNSVLVFDVELVDFK